MDFRNIKPNSKPLPKMQNHLPPEYRAASQPNTRPDRFAEPDVDLDKVLKRVSLFFGIALLAISIYFSYDGFDSSINGFNFDYTTLAKFIGVTLAVGVSLMQFVFSTSYKSLNWTLKLFGLAAYGYSMGTTYLGIVDVLHMHKTTAIFATIFIDGAPEPLISWSLGSSLSGDLVGNVLKMMFGSPKNSTNQNKYDVHPQFRDRIGK